MVQKLTRMRTPVDAPRECWLIAFFVLGFQRRFGDDFLLDLVFRAALDEQGQEIKGTMDERFWEQMSQKEISMVLCTVASPMFPTSIHFLSFHC